MRKKCQILPLPIPQNHVIWHFYEKISPLLFRSLTEGGCNSKRIFHVFIAQQRAFCGTMADIGGLHMRPSKTRLCKLLSICSKFWFDLQDHTTCFCNKFEVISTNENRVIGQRSWRIFCNVSQKRLNVLKSNISWFKTFRLKNWTFAETLLV